MQAVIGLKIRRFPRSGRRRFFSLFLGAAPRIDL
jgi:hypothetical protein